MPHSSVELDEPLHQTAITHVETGRGVGAGSGSSDRGGGTETNGTECADVGPAFRINSNVRPSGVDESSNVADLHRTFRQDVGEPTGGIAHVNETITGGGLVKVLGLAIRCCGNGIHVRGSLSTHICFF